MSGGPCAGGNKLLVKGAPECVLERCTQVQLPDGSVVALTPELRAEIAEAVAEMSKAALRCLGFAVKSGSALKARAVSSFAHDTRFSLNLKARPRGNTRLFIGGERV